MFFSVSVRIVGQGFALATVALFLIRLQLFWFFPPLLALTILSSLSA